MSLLWPALPSSILALGTTVHLALATFSHHRRPGTGVLGLLTLISVALGAAPWLLPSGLGLMLGFTVHGLWFIACERLAPSRPAHGTGTHPNARPRPEPAAAVRPAGFTQLPVLGVFEETPDIRTFRFARPDGFEFAAGQFLPIRMRIDGRDHVRCYSISSAPSTRTHLEISVKRQGLVSGTLHATVRPGTFVAARPPGGSFTYPAGDDRPLLLLAGGIGITPVLSMLRHAVASEPSRRVTLLYSAPTEDAFAFRREILTITGSNPQARALFAVTRGRGTAEFYPGRIDETLLRATVPDIAHTIAMICGPQPMIDGLRRTLASLGMPAADIRSERFEAAVAASAGHAPETGLIPGAQATAHRITCARSESTIHAAAGHTLLEAAEAGGVAIDSLCRSGVCGTCRTRVLEGDVTCESTLLDDADRERGFVLACVSHVQSDCVVDL